MVRVGVVGCGRIAARHVAAYRRLDGVEVVVADEVPGQAERLAREVDVSWRSTPEALYEDGRLDAIDVCVPTVSHTTVVLRALESGKHVFCEKPLCRTVEEGEAIAAAQRACRRVVMVGYLYRHHPGYRILKRALDEGAIGHPHLALFRLGGRGGTAEWKHSAASGGGAALEMLVHNLDLVLWLLGPWSSADVLRMDTLLRRRAVDGREIEATAEDYLLLRLRAGGAEVICESDLVTPGYMNHAEIHGDNGSGYTSILEHLPTVIFCRRPRGSFQAGSHVTQVPAVDLFEAELADFVAAVREGRAAGHSIEDSLTVLACLRDVLGAVV